jgi:hypothetical protein
MGGVGYKDDVYIPCTLYGMYVLMYADGGWNKEGRLQNKCEWETQGNKIEWCHNEHGVSEVDT